MPCEAQGDEACPDGWPAIEPLDPDVSCVWELYWRIEAVGWDVVRELAMSSSISIDRADWMLDALQQITYAVRRRQAVEAKQSRPS